MLCLHKEPSMMRHCYFPCVAHTFVFGSLTNHTKKSQCPIIFKGFCWFFVFHERIVLFVVLAFWGAKSRFHVEREGKESNEKAVIFAQILRTKISVATH